MFDTARTNSSVAKALDVVGDRWTLLIVRELLSRGPSRYTDLRSGLPGIATNLLADRLRELEAAGLVEREDARSEEHSLNSSHVEISYAVFCLKKKNNQTKHHQQNLHYDPPISSSRH